MQVDSIISPVALRGAVVRPAIGRVSARFLTSFTQVLGMAVRLSGELDHLSPRQQRDVALAWLHRSELER